MTNPASVMVPLDLVVRAASNARHAGAGNPVLAAELAAFLPKPDRAEDLWNEASNKATEEEAVAIIRAALDAPREATPEVAAAFQMIENGIGAIEPNDIAALVEAALATLAAQFEVRHDR